MLGHHHRIGVGINPVQFKGRGTHHRHRPLQFRKNRRRQPFAKPQFNRGEIFDTVEIDLFGAAAQHQLD